MATEQNEGAEQATGSSPATGWIGMIQEPYKKLKENIEAYPYVCGSYVVVYGGFGLYLTYRWRKLRRTEDRIRGLQKRLNEFVKAEEAAGKSAVTAHGKPSSPPAVESNNATK